MTFRAQLLLTATLFGLFLLWFLPLKYGRSPETKEEHRIKHHAWLRGDSKSALICKIIITILAAATTAHIILDIYHVAK